MKRNVEDKEFPRKIEDEEQKLELNLQIEIFVLKLWQSRQFINKNKYIAGNTGTDLFIHLLYNKVTVPMQNNRL